MARNSRAEAREIALLLLRLERQPEPPGSRELEPILIQRIPGERIWERPDWTVTYWLDRDQGLVVVGSVEPTRPRGAPPQKG